MDNKKTITLRKTTQDDCDDVFKWRNDEYTRKASFDSKPVDFTNHKTWFDNSLINQNRYMYIGETGTKDKVGVVRIDKLNEHVAEMSINIAPEMRGKGYGRYLIEQAGQLFRRANKGNIFIARAKKDNPASIRVFIKAGFFEMFDYDGKDCGKVVVLGLFAK